VIAQARQAPEQAAPAAQQHRAAPPRAPVKPLSNAADIYWTM
jgi:hypothetical protein